jgi:hypothetical protein
MLGYTAMVVTLNSLEINIAIFICCLPAMKTLLRRIKSKTSYPSPQANSPDFGKSPRPNDPLDSVASQSDSASNRQRDSIRGDNLTGNPV